MILELEVLASPEVERHLNRNPRVISYSGNDVLTVRFDSMIPLPAILRAEAKQLGLGELSNPGVNDRLADREAR